MNELGQSDRYPSETIQCKGAYLGGDDECDDKLDGKLIEWCIFDHI